MDSPYQQYLDMDYAPTADEARRIASIVRKSAKELADLDEQLHLLQEKRENIRSFSDRHQALLSPVRQLTRDILEEIFLACFPIDRNPCMSITEAPMLLTRICSSWRQIALSTPRLWAKIHIPLPVIQTGPGNVEEYTVQKEEIVGILKLRETAVNEWLGRSFTCPLSISIYQAPASLYSGSRGDVQLLLTLLAELQQLHVSFICNTIIPHHKRWRDFDIYAANDTLCELLDTGLKAENLGMLETFHVGRHDHFHYTPFGNDRGLPFRWKDFVSLMPSRITSATLHCFPVDNSGIFSISSHSWGNLTDLCLKLDIGNAVLPAHVFSLAVSILRHCYALITLKLMVFIFSGIHDTFHSELQHTEVIVLQYLTTLVIAIPIGPATLAFTNLLYLPSISEFGIDFNSKLQGESYSEQLPQDIISSLLRATEDLRVLTVRIRDWPSSSDDLVRLLEGTPSIRFLKITATSINVNRWPIYISHQRIHSYNFPLVVNNNLLQALIPTNKSDSDIICPKLEVLIFDHRETDITETCLKEFLVSRESDERVPPIRRISVYIDDFKQKEDMNTNAVILGPDSDVHFMKKKTSPYSPF